VSFISQTQAKSKGLDGWLFLKLVTLSALRVLGELNPQGYPGLTDAALSVLKFHIKPYHLEERNSS